MLSSEDTDINSQVLLTSWHFKSGGRDIHANIRPNVVLPTKIGKEKHGTEKTVINWGELEASRRLILKIKFKELGKVLCREREKIGTSVEKLKRYHTCLFEGK